MRPGQKESVRSWEYLQDVASLEVDKLLKLNPTGALRRSADVSLEPKGIWISVGERLAPDR